jgi:hypothetical protein
MADISAVSVSRPPLALRVGVTGARALAPDIVDRLRPLVADILNLIAKEMTQLAENQVAKPVYWTVAAGAAPFTLRLLTNYLGEKPLASSFLWHAYARLMEIVLPKVRRASTKP